ncbi:MAG: hypothetical protein HQM13_18990 [SAR324 cluster bacterium]|nr:hypothetical protein [SAR324 cluster bacterium]
MKIKKLLLPAFAAAVGISFVAAEVYAAQENVNFRGRARGYYVSSSSKANSDADTISNTQFKADSRFGMDMSSKMGDWTAKGRVAIDSSGFSKRDQYVMVGNKSFDVRMGRMYFGDACVTASYPIPGGAGDCVGAALGRSEGVQVYIKGLPVSLDVSYMDVDDGADDKTGFRGKVGFSAMNADIVLQYTSVNTAENGDRSADGTDDGSSSSNAPSIMVTVPIGKVTLSGGYETWANTMDDGNTSVDTGKNALIVAANVEFGADMSVGAMYNSTTETADDVDDTKTGTLQVGFKKKIGGATVNLGYLSSNTTADDTAGNDGAASTEFQIGMGYAL